MLIITKEYIYLHITNSQTQKINAMKTQMLNEQLKKANKGLENAHLYLSKAIRNNDADNENYYFEAVSRYAEMVNSLQKQIIKIK